MERKGKGSKEEERRERNRDRKSKTDDVRLNSRAQTVSFPLLCTKGGSDLEAY